MPPLLGTLSDELLDGVVDVLDGVFDSGLPLDVDVVPNTDEFAVSDSVVSDAITISELAFPDAAIPVPDYVPAMFTSHMANGNGVVGIGVT